jgi:hypothetical protein
MGTVSSRRSTLLKAFLASFAVHLIPLVDPHAPWLLGEHLWLGLVRRGPDRVAGWIALEWGVAVGLQIVAGALWYWFFARPKWGRLLLVAVCAPAFYLAAEWSYLTGIPWLFLVRKDSAPIVGDWRTACVFPNMPLAAVRSAPDLPLERAGEAWLIGSEMNAYAVLEMPNCRLRPVGLEDFEPLLTEPFVAPGGRCLFSTRNSQTGQNHWWYLDGTGSAPRPLPHPPPDPNRCSPILSADGNWVAWLEYLPGATVTPLPQRVVIRSLHDDRERLVTMPPPGRSEFVLLGLNVEAEELTFYEHEYATRKKALVVLGFDGARRGPPLVADGVDPQATTFLRVGGGWVAWDAYREHESYRVAWLLPIGRGTHPVLKGRGISAVAVNPAGTYVAISTTSLLNVGRIRDTVYVLRTRDGAEVWRRYMPPYMRSSVAFLGDRFFAYTEWNGIQDSVRVLRIPDG